MLLLTAQMHIYYMNKVILGEARLIRNIILVLFYFSHFVCAGPFGARSYGSIFFFMKKVHEKKELANQGF